LSVYLYKNRKETAQREQKYTKQYKNTEYTKQKYETNKKHKKNIIKHKSSN